MRSEERLWNFVTLLNGDSAEYTEVQGCIKSEGTAEVEVGAAVEQVSHDSLADAKVRSDGEVDAQESQNRS